MAFRQRPALLVANIRPVDDLFIFLISLVLAGVITYWWWREKTSGELVGKITPVTPEMGRMGITVKRNVVGVERQVRVLLGSGVRSQKAIQFSSIEAVQLAELLEAAVAKVKR